MPEEPLDDSTAEILLNRFVEAANLASSGQSAAALEKYQSIFTAENEEPIKGVVSGEFVATVELRKAYCLMDLGRYQEAKAIFEELDEFLAGQLDTDDLYYFYLSYGNTLGNLELLEKMQDRIARAMNIATEELQDLDKFRNAWYWLLYWEKSYQAWESLDEHCIDADVFGVQNNDLQLRAIAFTFRCYAHRGLGRIEAARQGAETILRWKQNAQEDPEALREWELFLESLDNASSNSD